MVGWTTDEDANSAGFDVFYDAGSEVIDKPFDLDTLARRVQAALARH